MHRRAFLALAASTPVTHLMPVYGQTKDVAFGVENPARELKADIVIIGGGMGGIACAIAAARNNLKVILTEEYDWIGGQVTSQAVPPDEHPWIHERGSTKTYRTYRTKVRDFYRRNYPLTEDAAKDTELTRHLHEPKVALAVLLEMLAPHVSAGRVRLIQPFIAERAETDRDTVTAISGKTAAGHRFVFTAPYFVDATETGELLPLAKVEHVTGSESRDDTKEPHAADKAKPHNHQAFTICFAMDYEPDKDNTIEKPEHYKQWLNFVPKLDPAWPGNLLSWEMSDPQTLKPRVVGFNPTGAVPKGLNLWSYRRIVAKSKFTDDAALNDVTIVNWPQNDYFLGNLYETDEWAQNRASAYGLSECLLYWLQTEAPHPGGRKEGWKGLRLRPDVTGTQDSGYGFAMAPYIRESRRIKAVFTVTENHVGTDARAKQLRKLPGEFTAEKFDDTVGTGSYRIDLHPSSGGDNYIDVSSLPFQIPLGALIPQRVENLLPACKNIGTTHVTNGCYRLHPVEWSIGEAVGELVAFCISKKRVPRQVRKDAKLLADYQAQLAKVGSDLHWPDEIARSPR